MSKFLYLIEINFITHDGEFRHPIAVIDELISAKSLISIYNNLLSQIEHDSYEKIKKDINVLFKNLDKETQLFIFDGIISKEKVKFKYFLIDNLCKEI